MKQAIYFTLVSFLGIGLLQSADLGYEGKTFREWAHEISDVGSVDPDDPAVIALKAITKESLPELIQILQPDNSDDKEDVGCCGVSGDDLGVADAQITLEHFK